jgi:hypothetical protein
LFAFCALFAFIVVTPLWKFSVNNPALYSFFVGLTALLFILFFFIKRLRSFFLITPKEDQKIKIQNFIRSMVLLILLIAAIIIFFLFVLEGYRFWGLLSLITGLFLYGIAAFVYKRK